MKLLAAFIFVIAIDLITTALYKSAKKGDKTLKRPDFIKIRSKK